MISAIAAFVLPALAQATPAQPAPQGGFEGLLSSPLVLIIPLLLVWMFVLGGGKRKDEKKRKLALAALKRGDRVQTIGGVLGTVVETEDSKVRLKVDESSNAKMWFSRDAIFKLLGEEKAAESEKK